MVKQATLLAVLAVVCWSGGPAAGQTPRYGFGAQPQAPQGAPQSAPQYPPQAQPGFQQPPPVFQPQVSPQAPQFPPGMPPQAPPQFGAQPGGQLGISLVGGVWTGTIDDGGMMAQVATEFRPDGTYMSLENIQQAGLRMQVLGRYTVQVLSPTQAAIQVTPVQWLPQQVCNQARQCQPFTPPPSTISLQVLGQDMVQTDAGSFQRGPVPDFARAPVPQTAYLPGGGPNPQ